MRAARSRTLIDFVLHLIRGGRFCRILINFCDIDAPWSIRSSLDVERSLLRANHFASLLCGQLGLGRPLLLTVLRLRVEFVMLADVVGAHLHLMRQVSLLSLDYRNELVELWHGKVSVLDEPFLLR